MSLATLTYTPTIRRPRAAATLDYQLLDTAAELYDSGQFVESTLKVFEHLFGDAAANLTSQPFSFVQGSSTVTAKLEDQILFVSVPLVKLPAGGSAIAALRYLLASVNGPGLLHQARLRGDEVHLEVAERISSLHPQKLLEILRRTPIDADRHDDWMISQFGAGALGRVSIEPISDDEAALAQEVWKGHWNDVEELLKETQRKRSMWFLNETTSYAVNRLRHVMPLGGSLLPRLLEAAGTFNNAHVDPMKRETALSKCIKDMKAVTADELRNSLGHASYAITPVAQGTPQELAGFFAPGDYLDSVGNFRQGGHYMDAAISLIGTTYYLLANYWWPAEVEEQLKLGLTESSGKGWHDVSNSLFAHVKAIAEQYAADAEGEDDDDDEEEEEEGDDEEETENE